MFGFEVFALLNESFVLHKIFKLFLHSCLKGKGLEMVSWDSVLELLLFKHCYFKHKNVAESPAIPGPVKYVKSEFIENAAWFFSPLN